MRLSKIAITKIFLSFFLFSAIAAGAQRSDTALPKHSNFKFSVSYLSNAVYAGRKDTFAVPYIIPSISYHTKSGLYFEGSVSYLAGVGAQIDAGDLTAGYEFDSKSGKFSGDIYGTKYITSSSSYSVKEEIKGSIGSALYYDAGPVSLDGGADLFFSGKTDVMLDLGVSHAFEFGKDKSWAITPAALVNAGTQNFYKDYLANRKYSQQRRRRNTAGANTTNVIVINKSFAVLDYEISLPVDYTTHKWGLFFTPSFSIPVNGFKYSINNGVTYRAENLTNSFYIEAGGFIKF